MGLAKTFLAIGIAVLFVVFVAYGVYVVYEPPRYESTDGGCYEEFDCHNLTNECRPDKAINASEPRPVEYDNNCYDRIYDSPEYRQCQEKEDECRESFIVTTDTYKHARNSFFALIIIGLLAMSAGVYFSGLEGIGAGLLGGGVLVILWTLPYTWRYWLEFNKYFKLVILGGVLVFLIYIGYKKLDKKISKKKW